MPCDRGCPTCSVGRYLTRMEMCMEIGKGCRSGDGVIGVPVTATAGWARTVLSRGDGDLPGAGSGVVTDVGERAFQARHAKVPAAGRKVRTLPLPALSSTASSEYMYGPCRLRASRGLELPSLYPGRASGLVFSRLYPLRAVRHDSLVCTLLYLL